LKRTAFCFTGEGARGSIQAGIALSLYESNIKPELTIGISSGSICAASYAYLGPQGVADMWSNIKNIFDVFGINYFPWRKTGMLNQKPMEKIVSNALKNTPVCESIVSKLNIHSGEMMYVSNKGITADEFKENVLSSVAITGLVEDRNGWVDAGSRQLAPLKQCIDLGYNEIYVIMGRPLTLSYWEGAKGILKPLEMAFRALDISLYEIMIRDINQHLNNNDIEIYLVEPDKLFFDSVYFNQCKNGVQYGRKEYTIHDKKSLRNILPKIVN